MENSGQVGLGFTRVVIFSDFKPKICPFSERNRKKRYVWMAKQIVGLLFSRSVHGTWNTHFFVVPYTFSVCDIYGIWQADDDGGDWLFPQPLLHLEGYDRQGVQGNHRVRGRPQVSFRFVFTCNASWSR